MSHQKFPSIATFTSLSKSIRSQIFNYGVKRGKSFFCHFPAGKIKIFRILSARDETVSWRWPNQSLLKLTKMFNFTHETPTKKGKRCDKRLLAFISEIKISCKRKFPFFCVWKAVIFLYNNRFARSCNKLYGIQRYCLHHAVHMYPRKRRRH